MKSETVFEDGFFELRRYSGTVTDANTKIRTHVSGGGFDYVSIKSSTSEISEFFLIDDEGAEGGFKIYNWGFSMRTGHEVQVYSLFDKRKNLGEYVLVKNRNLNEAAPNFYNLKAVIKRRYKWPAIWSALFLIFVSPVILKFILPPVLSVFPSLEKVLNSFLFPLYLILLVAIFIIYQVKSHFTFSSIKKVLLAETVRR